MRGHTCNCELPFLVSLLSCCIKWVGELCGRLLNALYPPPVDTILHVSTPVPTPYDMSFTDKSLIHEAMMTYRHIEVIRAHTTQSKTDNTLSKLAHYTPTVETPWSMSSW